MNEIFPRKIMDFCFHSTFSHSSRLRKKKRKRINNKISFSKIFFLLSRLGKIFYQQMITIKKKGIIINHFWALLSRVSLGHFPQIFFLATTTKGRRRNREEKIYDESEAKKP